MMGDKLPDNIKPIVDGDWVAYKSCSAIEYGEDHPEDTDFEDVLWVMNKELKQINEVLGTEEEPIMCFNGKGNFRDAIATQQKYKGVRPPKPYHYSHLVDYIDATMDVSKKDGLEGDDTMAVLQTWYNKKGIPSCIVSIDKDLRAVPGWHYSPEIWNAASFGPIKTDELGWIKLSDNRKKVIGMGLRFFYAQCLTGDNVDKIPGCPGVGPVAAFEQLEECGSDRELYEAVRWAYRGVSWEPDECLLEQARLLWMIREVKDDEPVMWFPPEE